MSLTPLIVVAACSDEEASTGQLMVALQTDMAIPKDIDAVRVEIATFGNVHFADEFEVGPGGIKIPATLGVVAGKKADPVTIVVTSSREGEVHTLREVVTTVPRDRIATLRIPIEWLCWNQVEETEDGQLTSTCPTGQSCENGRCVDNEIDSEALPDFRAEAIFGGGSGEGDGECFDTVACFAEGFGAAVDMDDCTLEKPTGGAGPSVALVTPPGGAGICGDQVCLVPLDEENWTDAGDRIELPQAACDRLEDETAVAVAVTTACTPKTEGLPTCGPWSSVRTDDGEMGGPGPMGIMVTDAGADAELAPDAGADASDAGVISRDAGLGDAGATHDVEARIGVIGGDVTSSDGVLTMSIPTAALSMTTTMTIDPAPDAPPESLGPAYDIGPSGTQFAAPVTVEYDTSLLDLALSPDARPILAVAEGGAWVPLADASFDSSTGIAQGTVTHLSVFGLIAGSTTGTDASAGVSEGGTARSDSGAGGCQPRFCNGTSYSCGDCVDNDADGFADHLDPDCTGPCDNDESTTLTAIPGDNLDCRAADCYFDGDSGSGNDGCSKDFSCDPEEPTSCTFLEGATCADPQPQQCLDVCLPITPNGCDCFGCCELPAESGNFVYLGSSTNPGCSATDPTNPMLCFPCTPTTDCMNSCETCELCLGKPALPDTCGGTQRCSAGAEPCGLPGDAPCPTGKACITGCCQPEPGTAL